MTEVCAVMIVRNAEDTLPACLESIRPHVDHLVIVDTGSTDTSPEIAKLYANRWERWTGCNVDPRTGQEDQKIWDFAAARNKSFELVPDGMAAMWLDADDILVGAEHLRRLASELPDGPGACLLPYEYSYADAACTLPTCIHWRERLIKHPQAFVWTTPCHEVCVPRSGGVAHTQSGEVIIKHRAQQSKNPREPQRNLRILTAYLQRVGESDPRAMYYCGVEYARHGMFGKAREILRRYVEIGSWSDEKCLAELELARVLLQEGDCKQALEWADRALNTKSWPDPYWLKAKTFWRMALEGSNSDQEYNLRRAHAWAERGRPLEDAQTVLFYNPQERFETERIVNRICAHFGRIDEAAESCRRGLAGMPGDPDLFEQLKAYEAVLIGRELDTLLGRLVHLGKIDERTSQTVQALLTGQLQVAANDAQPAGPHPFARIGTGEAVDETGLPAPADGCLDIVIFTGPAFEDWSPRTIDETGIGGSETMAWEMARGLAKLGHRVRHYGWCRPDQEGVYEGVYWYDSARYRDIRCDALIVSRYADGVQCPGGVTARARLLWTHDVWPANLTPEHAGRYDRVLCLSEWQKGVVAQGHPFLDPERIVVTRNGIDPALFDGDEERNNQRVIYSSSPDRGLETLLALWPDIVAQVPGAELHAFYGLDNLRKTNPADAARIEATIANTPRVTMHGRVSPKELAREFKRSGAWLYPTWWVETSCITAMQAQAAGCRVVTTPLAALNETCAGAAMFVDGAPGPVSLAAGHTLHPPSAEYRTAFVAAAVKALTDPDVADQKIGSLDGYTVRARVAWEAKHMRFALGPLASDWSAMLAALVAELDRDKVSRFYVAPEFERAGRGVDEEAA